jgi:hypothetical protein
MGLDAVVYKNRTKLPLDPERAGLRLDQSTGEWHSETDELPDAIRVAGIEAIHKRLGNASLIAAIAAETRSHMPTDSMLVSRILFSGSHAGDAILPETVESLKQEVLVLKNSSPSPELTRFLNDLDELIAAAQDNNNPIVFV